MNRSLRFLIFGILLSSVVSCSKRTGKLEANTAPIPVEVAATELLTVPVEMKTIGSVEPIASVQLKSKVPGEILQVHFADGAQVKAGDPLFSIDPRTYEAALKRAQANLAMAQSQATNSTEQAQRYTTLTKQGVASREQVSQFLTTAEAQKSELAARQADVDEAQLSLEWTQIRAPLRGRSGAALLKAGNIVQANTEVLAVINQIQPIYVTFSLPEASFAEIREWMTKSTPHVTAYDANTGQKLGEGNLSFVDNAVDKTSGMISFKGTFPNENESLWPGQFVDVTLKLAEQKDAIVIPSSAVMEGQLGSQVFVVNDNVATLRPVVLDRTVGNQSIIKEGLAAGEKVIITGQLRVSSGSKVAVKEAVAPAAPAQASN